MQKIPSEPSKAQAEGSSTYAAFETFGSAFYALGNLYIRPIPSQTLLLRALDGAASDPDFATPATRKAVATAKAQLARKDAADILGQLGVFGDAVEKVAASSGSRPPPSLIYRSIAEMAGGLDAYTRFTCAKLSIGVGPQRLENENVPAAPVTGRLLGTVAYLRVGALPTGAAETLLTAFASLKARAQASGGLSRLILDLRSNPGGLIDQTRAVADKFLPDGAPIATTITRAAKTNQKYLARQGDITNGLPIAVLIDSGTSAGAEIIAGALQDNHRAQLFGQTTHGHGTVQTILPEGDSCHLILTTDLVILPSGRSLEAGIHPDIALARSSNASGDADEIRSVLNYYRNPGL